MLRNVGCNTATLTDVNVHLLLITPLDQARALNNVKSRQILENLDLN